MQRKFEFSILSVFTYGNYYRSFSVLGYSKVFGIYYSRLYKVVFLNLFFKGINYIIIFRVS